ncbi:hypothetical protein ElyMa_001439500 [Elysia marginata]|uniref:Uncharacterized protein n=1 Tax=Elysia marginata TaxID=1093978 RepID=A0AAV4J032_9GAST|nr:hypothetical protein ElyMa_001439500 [Elysia marginata]
MESFSHSSLVEKKLCIDDNDDDDDDDDDDDGGGGGGGDDDDDDDDVGHDNISDVAMTILSLKCKLCCFA